jgi:dTMP kinase
MRGKFIVFEGIDGSGKTTAMNNICDYFSIVHGYKLLRQEEPTTNAIGEIFREMMEGDRDYDPEICAGLIMMDRYDHITRRTEGLIDSLNNGYSVICTRYTYSTIAYNMTGVNSSYVLYCSQKMRELLRPDLEIFLDISPELAKARLDGRKEDEQIFENLDRLVKNRKAYLDAFSLYGENDNIYVYDVGKKSKEEVATDLIAEIAPLLREVQ